MPNTWIFHGNSTPSFYRRGKDGPGRASELFNVTQLSDRTGTTTSLPAPALSLTTFVQPPSAITKWPAQKCKKFYKDQ